MSYEIYERLIKEKGIKSATVSRATGISQTVFSEWKKGKATPKADKIKKIADYLGVTSDYIMTGEAPDGYYINPETAKKAQEIFDTPGMAALFDAAKDSRPEDLQMAADMLRRLKGATLHLDDDVQ